MLINTSKRGQLGNRLQLFAHLIAFAIENNQKIINLGFAEYADYFESTSKDALCRYPARRSIFKYGVLIKLLSKILCFLIRKKIPEKTGIKKFKTIYAFPCSKPKIEIRLDDPDFLASITNNQIIFTWGYHFVDYINLIKHSDKIREYFLPLASNVSNINLLIKKARESCKVLVGVHIRQHKDYKGYQDGKFYFEIDEYINLMKRMERLVPDKRVGFLICSDELQSADRFGSLTVFLGAHHPVEDMYSLARCDYIIGPCSTYSRWACFYGNVPTYHVDDINYNFTLNDFMLYEDMVQRHIETAEIFPQPANEEERSRLIEWANRPRFVIRAHDNYGNWFNKVHNVIGPPFSHKYIARIHPDDMEKIPKERLPEDLRHHVL